MNQLTHYLLMCVLLVSSSGENCDKYGIRLYEDLACTPVNTSGVCPSSYDCNLQPPNSNQCIVRGKIYNQGEHIPTNKQDHTCEFGCSCQLPKVACPQWGCGNWAGFPPLAPDCYRVYTLESCCSTGEICPPFNDTTTCTVDGVVYKAGEKFFPQDSCYACVCQKGFKGKYEKPFCKRSGCDAQVKNQNEIQKNCAPVYIPRDKQEEKRCCPYSWTCPDGSEVIKSNGQKSDSTCKFGNKIMNIGDSFEKKIELGRVKNIKCECKIPPLLLCYEI